MPSKVLHGLTMYRCSRCLNETWVSDRKQHVEWHKLQQVKEAIMKASWAKRIHNDHWIKEEATR